MHSIETQHRRIPWRRVVLLSILEQSRIFVLLVSGSMIFTMKKFIESPIIINSVVYFALQVKRGKVLRMGRTEFHPVEEERSAS